MCDNLRLLASIRRRESKKERIPEAGSFGEVQTKTKNSFYPTCKFKNKKSMYFVYQDFKTAKLFIALFPSNTKLFFYGAKRYPRNRVNWVLTIPSII